MLIRFADLYDIQSACLLYTSIISDDDRKKIVDTLKNILEEIEEGSLEIDPSAEDIHSLSLIHI